MLINTAKFGVAYDQSYIILQKNLDNNYFAGNIELIYRVMLLCNFTRDICLVNFIYERKELNPTKNYEERYRSRYNKYRNIN